MSDRKIAFLWGLAVLEYHSLCLALRIHVLTPLRLDCAGFASDALAGQASGTAAVPATVMALKTPTANIKYDELVHERFPPGDTGKKAFTYLVLTGMSYVSSFLSSLLSLSPLVSDGP